MTYKSVLNFAVGLHKTQTSVGKKFLQACLLQVKLQLLLLFVTTKNVKRIALGDGPVVSVLGSGASFGGLMFN